MRPPLLAAVVVVALVLAFGVACGGAAQNPQEPPSEDQENPGVEEPEAQPEVTQTQPFSETAEGRAAASELMVIDEELGFLVDGVDGIRERIFTLQNAEESLSEALGGGDDSCTYDSVKCDVVEAEEQLEEDRPELQEIISSGGSDNGVCTQVINPSYWESGDGISEAAMDEYEDARDAVEEAATGVDEDIAEGYEELEVAQGLLSRFEPEERPEMNYDRGSIEQLERNAEEAKEVAQAAISGADGQRTVYEQRARNATNEALGLYEEAGCE